MDEIGRIFLYAPSKTEVALPAEYRELIQSQTPILIFRRRTDEHLHNLGGMALYSVVCPCRPAKIMAVIPEQSPSLYRCVKTRRRAVFSEPKRRTENKIMLFGLHASTTNRAYF